MEVSDDIVEIGETGGFEVEADSDGRNTGFVRNIEDEAEEQNDDERSAELCGW